MVRNKSGKKKLNIPGLENNQILIARFAQLYVSDLDMKKPMFVSHIGNRHNRFNIFVHGIYGENDEGEKEREITMMIIEHLERGKKVDMIMIFPNLNEDSKSSPFTFHYAKKSNLDFKPEFFMTSKKMMDWDRLAKKLGKSIDNKKIIEYLI